MNSMYLPTITVVTPSFNQGQYLEQTILSVLSQNYPHLEYIVIDGGSTDNSVEIIKRFEKQISYWISEPDKGQSNAINKGFRNATGDIVCWLNSDDLLMPGTLRKVGQAFSEDPSLEVVTGYTVRTDAQLRILFNHYVPKPCSWLARQGILYTTQASFWKQKLLERVGYLDESLHWIMDLDLWMKCHLARVKSRHLRDIFFVWRLHEMCKTVCRGEILQEHARLMERYRHMHYHSPLLRARLLYYAWKCINGDYLKQWLFQRRWKGRPLSELIEAIRVGTL